MYTYGRIQMGLMNMYQQLEEMVDPKCKVHQMEYQKMEYKVQQEQVAKLEVADQQEITVQIVVQLQLEEQEHHIQVE